MHKKIEFSGEYQKYLPFLFLYFMQNIPITFLMKFMPIYISKQQNNILSPVEIINMLSVIFLPYLLRFIFSPIVSSFGIKKYHFRIWILFANIGYIASLLLLIDIKSSLSLNLMISALLINACFAVIQDIALDANATRIFTSVKQQNNISTIQQIFTLSIMPATTYLLYLLYENTQKLNYVLFVLVIPSLVACLFLFKMQETTYKPKPLLQQYKDIFSFFNKKNNLFLLILSFFYLPTIGTMYIRPYLSMQGHSFTDIAMFMDLLPSVVATITVLFAPRILHFFKRQNVVIFTYAINVLMSWLLTYVFYLNYINIHTMSIIMIIVSISSSLCLISFLAQLMSIIRPKKEVIDYSIAISSLYLFSMITFMFSGVISKSYGMFASYVSVSIISTIAWIIIIKIINLFPWKEQAHKI